MVKITLTLDYESYADIIENHPTIAEKISDVILNPHCISWSEEVENND